MQLKSLMAGLAILALAGCASMHNEPPGAVPQEEQMLANQATDVLHTAMHKSPSKRIPRALLNSARCIGVFPSFTQAAFIVGGAQGKGIIACQNESGTGWNDASPAFYTMTSGSIGFQAGIQSSSIILLFLTSKGVDALTSSQIRLGSDITVAAGPLGWNASIEHAPAAIVSYQVAASGLFAGINLNGTKLSFDRTSTSDVYDNRSIAGPQDVLFRMDVVPASVNSYNRTLAQITSE